MFFVGRFVLYFVQSVYARVCMLDYIVSFVGRFVLFQSVLYQKFHCMRRNDCDCIIRLVCLEVVSLGRSK